MNHEVSGHCAGVAARRAARRRVDDGGSVALEAVVVIPVAMLLVLVAVQACLWAHAHAIVQAAAAEGDQAACDLNGSPAAGLERAKAFLTAAAGSSVSSPVVSISQPAAGEIQVRVNAGVESVVPWLHLDVSAVRVGTVQTFRSQQ